MLQIIILAMVALFVGLRLYAVLGRRTGHEQSVVKPVEAPLLPAAAVPALPSRQGSGAEPVESAIGSGAGQGIRAIVGADPSFDLNRFLAGAQSAYRSILEAFWKGDEDALRSLVDDEVAAAFAEAIRARGEAGHRLDNRLVTIERAVVESARLEGRTATITVRFDADVAAVTRDRDGQMVAGSLTDAVQTHDLWTFRRTVRADDPNWILIETDEAA